LEEVLGSSNAYFGVKGKELKKAERRYVSLPHGKALGLFKLAMSNFTVEGRVYTGASFSSEELT